MAKKSLSEKYFKFSIYLVFIVLLNLAGMNLFFRQDLTQNKIYSLSKASQKVVSTLSEPLTINVFFTKNLPAPHNNTERYLKDLLEEYSNYSNRYFNYRFYDVSPDEGDVSGKTVENRELAGSYGIFPVQIQVVEEDEVKFQKAYMGLVLLHGDLMERIPTITSVDRLEYRLTTAVKKLNNKISALLNLPEKIRIKLFFSSSLEKVAPLMGLKDLPALPRKIESVVKKLNNKNYGKLEYEYLDPFKDQDLNAEAKKYQILSLKWPAISRGKIPAGKGVIGLVMEYGDKAVTIPLIRVLNLPIIGTHYEMTEFGELEGIINENLETLIDINEDLGFLAGHGSLNKPDAPSVDPMGQRPQGEISNLRAMISKNYTIKDVNLKDGNIPDGLNCLIIAGPTETFSDYDLFLIDQFLMGGGNLGIFLNAFNEVMPSNEQSFRFRRNQGPLYLPLDTGLAKLLSHYGISIGKAYVMDENCYKQQLPPRFGGGEQSIYFAPLIKSRHINHDCGFMKNIKGLVALKISPLELDDKRIKENDILSRLLFSSSEKSWEMSGQINLNPMFIRPPQSSDDKESRPLAYILEGEFPSYFAGKSIPEKISDEKKSEEGEPEKKTKQKSHGDLSKIEGTGEFISLGKPGKIFLMASSEMLKDNVVDEEGRTPNAMFIMNTVDYLNNREDIAVMRSKEQRFNPLHDTKASTRTFVKFFNIGGLPVLVIISGLLIWLLRHSRRKRIRMMFQK